MSASVVARSQSCYLLPALDRVWTGFHRLMSVKPTEFPLKAPYLFPCDSGYTLKTLSVKHKQHNLGQSISLPFVAASTEGCLKMTSSITFLGVSGRLTAGGKGCAVSAPNGFWCRRQFLLGLRALNPAPEKRSSTKTWRNWTSLLGEPCIPSVR